MLSTRTLKITAALSLPVLLLSMDASAAIDSNGLMTDVANRFKTNASGWAGIFESTAEWLFWCLATISMVWTFGMLALKKADIGEFFAEFVRFTIFTGFYFWLLKNGPEFAIDIIDSLQTLGGRANALGGFAGDFTPSSIVDIGFICLGKALSEVSGWSPIDSFIGVVLSLAVLVLMTLIAVNMLLLLISAWILAYAGVFFLGFGGCKWTSDMAINYYKTVLGIAAQIMTMLLIVGIGKNIIFEYFDNMQEGVNFMEMAIVVVVAIVLFVLTNKLPQLISGIITGASVGGAGIGTFGAGAALGAAGMAAAAAATGGAAMMAGAANIGGGAQALMAAFKGAQDSVASGGSMDSGSSDSGGGSLSDAMGLNSSDGGSSTQSGSSPTESGGGSTQSGGGSSESGGSTQSGSGSSESGGSSTESGGSATESGGGSSESGGSSTESGGSSTESGGGSSESGGSSTESGGGSSESGGSTESGGGGSKLANAGKVAAAMGSSLASGMGRMAANKANAIADSAKSRIADTAGGRLAQEISNPGAKAQERKDNQDIAKAESVMSEQSRGEQADQAREFLAQQSSPSFDGDSIGGSSNNLNEQEEIAAFRDRTS